MQNETIICVSTAVWNSIWRPIHQTIWRIAEHNKIYFFEPGRNPDKSVVSETFRNLPNFFSVQSEKVNDNLTLIPCPSTITYARQHLPRSVLQVTTPVITRINTSVLMRHIQGAIKQFNIRNPILWLYEPRHYQLIGHLGEKFVVYYNYDEFPNFVANRKIKELVRYYDDELTRKSNVVVCTGRSQYEHRVKVNPNTHFIPNAADFQNFSKAVDPATPVPADIAHIKKPIIGFVGWLGVQIDMELLVKIAEKYADCSLVIVGPDALTKNEHYHKLHMMPNVTFTGKKELDELPGYLKQFDVALIPYILDGYVLTAYPLKLHEYLAAGRAIVATDMPELRPFSDVVRIAKDHDDFARLVGEAMHDNSPEIIEKRVAIARENTWEKRIEAMYAVLDPMLTASAPTGANAS